ncbi:hypothetical protein AB0I60_07920 [Actinosynnema sp. NPDC050436]|uniref:hypothetical protein n=1 Tax=Actinosynnema sp. NPDC050436 TaxID=3155659 RepID=UPI0033CDB6A7
MVTRAPDADTPPGAGAPPVAAVGDRAARANPPPPRERSPRVGPWSTRRNP